MKRPLMTVFLTCLLSVSALAGEQHTGDSPAPTPSGTPGMTASPVEILSTPIVPTSEALQQISDAALSALLSVFSFV